MKRLILLLVIGIAACGGYALWNNSREAAPFQRVAEEPKTELEQNKPAPAPENEPTLAPQPAETVETTSPTPAAPATKLAPDGVFYVTQDFSVATDDGIRGIRVGTKVTLVEDRGAILRVSDGQQEFDAKRELLTNDLDLVSRVHHAQQTSQQAAVTEWDQKQRQAAIQEKQKRVAAQSSADVAPQNLALQKQEARRTALNQEAAKIETTISEYRISASRTGSIRHGGNARGRVIGDTHANEIASLQQRLVAIRSELQAMR